jgi:hypothetical protein
MLSSVLKSERAVRVNVEIMRAFVRLRQLLASHADLARKLDALEKKYDAQFKVVFDAIRELMKPLPEKPKGRIGFRAPGRARMKVARQTFSGDPIANSTSLAAAATTRAAESGFKRWSSLLPSPNGAAEVGDLFDEVEIPMPMIRLG